MNQLDLKAPHLHTKKFNAPEGSRITSTFSSRDDISALKGPTWHTNHDAYNKFTLGYVTSIFISTLGKRIKHYVHLNLEDVITAWNAFYFFTKLHLYESCILISRQAAYLRIRERRIQQQMPTDDSRTILCIQRQKYKIHKYLSLKLRFINYSLPNKC